MSSGIVTVEVFPGERFKTMFERYAESYSELIQTQIPIKMVNPDIDDENN